MVTTGTHLGPYEILGLIGAGGMGEVYRAKDTRLGRDVAIKVLPAEFAADPDRLRRFEQEAQAIATLNHPNILAIHDIGTHEGRPYIVTELLEGESLRERLRTGGLTVRKAVETAVQIAQGLAAAHEKGIVHRDLKPANVFVTKDGHLKILDFGIAKLIAPRSLREPAQATTVVEATETGTTLGTVGYMSPEQLRGQPVDHRSDLFSFGAVLHEMLSGGPPFRRDTAADTASAILHEDPVPLSSGSPRGLDRIVRRCLEKRPEDRFQSARDIGFALQAEAEALVTPSTPGPASRPRRWVWVGAAALVALGVAAGSLYLVVSRGRPRGPGAPVASGQIRSIAVLPLANLSGDPAQEYFSDGMTEELITSLSKISALKVISRTSVMRFKGTKRPIPEIASALGVDAVIEGSVLRAGERVRITVQLISAATDTHMWAESYERDLRDVLALQSEVARAVAGEIKATLTPEQETRLASARQVNPKVYEAYLRGMFYVSQNTPESFEKGIELLHEAVAIDPAEPLAYVGLADGYITLGHGGGEQPNAFQRARAAAEQALKLDPDRAEAVGILADVALYYEWDWAKAERLFKRALQLNPSLAMTHYHYAWCLALFDRLDEAIAEHKLARDLDPLRALNTGWLGGLYNYGGRYDEAIVEANKALELNPNFWPSYLVLRFAYSSKGMNQEAIATALRHIDVNPSAGKVQLIIAYANAGQREQALKILSTLDRPAAAPIQLALMHLALGDRDAALRELEAAYEAHRATLPWIRVRGDGLDALRDEPRFQDLLRRMNLPM
jgi:serine/threonine protein kinase/tetratricopeptide (TPR) repeat protein